MTPHCSSMPRANTPARYPCQVPDLKGHNTCYADQGRHRAPRACHNRQGRQPRPLRRLPDGQGRHPSADVPGDSAAHCRTAAAASACTGMRCSMVMRSRATDGRSASRCQQKWPDQPLRPPCGVPRLRPVVRAARSCQNAEKSPKIHALSGFIWGIPVNCSYTQRYIVMSYKFDLSSPANKNHRN
jgi:hypothetical protein